MEVSFKGIDKLYMAKRSYSKFGSYLANNGRIKQGNKNYTEVMINCNLVNDARGNDLNEFLRTLSQCRPCYQNNCVNRQNMNQFKLLMRHFSVPDGAGVQNSEFKINDYEIMLDEKEILPLFTYMAKLTRTIASAKDPTEAYKNCARFVNTAIHNEAMNFIENSM